MFINEMDVDKYLSRIKYTGSKEPSLANLKTLIQCQKYNTPYTNLQMHGGKRIKLSLEEIYHNVVTNKGGGICYELGSLFVWLLQQLGYRAYGYQAAFYCAYLPEPVFSVPYFHFLVCAEIGDEKYLVDPGWIMFGPMKIELWTPYVDDHAIYRLTHAEGYDDTWYHMERHRKTVIDQNGVVLKQGPTPAGPLTDCHHPDWKQTQSSDWIVMFRFEAIPREIEEFDYMIDYIYQPQPDSLMSTNMLLIGFCGNQVSMSFEKAGYTKKESVDGVTDRIIEESEWSSNEDVKKSAKDIYKYDVLHNITYFK